MIGIYLRVSTEKQDETMQINAIKRCIGEEEFSRAYIYKDFGITGSTTDRPGYQRLLADITEGMVDKVVVYEFSRLWRDLEEQNRMFKRFKELKIHLQSTSEGFVDTEDDELKANILGSVNQHEIKRLRRRIKEGIERKKKDVADGKSVWKGRGPDKKKRKRRNDKR